MQTEAYAKQAADPKHLQNFPGHANWLEKNPPLDNKLSSDGGK